jgi:cytochrome c-type biogenesis protein CcmH/NrfF
MRLALAALAVVSLTLAAPAFASERHPSQSELESELVCPTCHTTLDESDAPIARQMKAHIRTWIAQGWTKSRIKDQLVAEFGDGVLGVPGKHGFDLLAWLLPLGGIGIGAVGLAAGAWYWSHGRGDPTDDDASDKASLASTGPALDPALERRVDEELARFDA